MMIFFATIFLTVIAYLEYTGVADAKVLACYHYPVSAAILYWQLSGNATTISILFLSGPRMLTLWGGTLAAFMPASVPAAML